MSLYDKLYKAVQKGYPFKSGKDQQAQTIKLWNELKVSCGKDKQELDTRVTAEIKKLEIQATQSKFKRISTFFNRPTDAEKSQNALDDVAALPPINTAHSHEVMPESLTANVSTQQSTLEKAFPVPAQEALKLKIDILQENICNMKRCRDNDIEISPVKAKDLQKKHRSLEELKKKLKRRKYQTEKCRIRRAERRNVLAGIIEENPDVGKKLKVRLDTGRPRVEVDQPMLLQTIIDIVLQGSSADNRRRTDVMRSCRTLTELTDALLKEGFQISRSGTYLRLLPKSSNTHEGKRHIETVPVKLAKPRNDLHRSHPDSKFATRTIRNLEDIAGTLGPEAVIFLSQDDKSRVPIGLPAAQYQTPLLMHLEYRIILPDHDFVIAERHKLIPSVYAICSIKSNSIGKAAVGYSGPTFISIRSGKHSSSTAETHAHDLTILLDHPQFATHVKDSAGKIKPVLIMTVDGGPDENPRYQKVIKAAICHFLKYNLDAVFIASNAPGRSAFNRVERRMAPLSKLLAGVILPAEHYGSHLDSQGRTIDADMEKKNFENAALVLADVWNGNSIDGYPVIASYMDEKASASVENTKDQEWYSKHVQESQYFLQIVKCKDHSCCGTWRSDLGIILPDRFLPAPLLVKQTEQGLVCVDLKGSSDITNAHFLPLFHLTVMGKQLSCKVSRGFKVTPYDLFCPGILSQLGGRCCRKCGKYHASKKSAATHQSWCDKVPHTAPKLIRPVRVAAQRQRELMVIINNDLNYEDCEWEDEDLTEVPNGALAELVQSHQWDQVIPIAKSLQPVWANALDDVQ